MEGVELARLDLQILSYLISYTGKIAIHVVIILGVQILHDVLVFILLELEQLVEVDFGLELRLLVLVDQDWSQDGLIDDFEVSKAASFFLDICGAVQVFGQIGALIWVLEFRIVGNSGLPLVFVF
jgi:hypothetical protein